VSEMYFNNFHSSDIATKKVLICIKIIARPQCCITEEIVYKIV